MLKFGDTWAQPNYLGDNNKSQQIVRIGWFKRQYRTFILLKALWYYFSIEEKNNA